MSDTTLISLRIPNPLLAEIDAKAQNLKRSRAWVIVDALENGPAKQAPVERKPDLPVEPKPLNPRVRAISEPTKVKSCPLCFALNGMHQRGCKNG